MTIDPQFVSWTTQARDLFVAGKTVHQVIWWARDLGLSSAQIIAVAREAFDLSANAQPHEIVSPAQVFARDLIVTVRVYAQISGEPGTLVGQQV